MDALAPRVFLVEDDAAVRDSVRTLLECYGIEVRDYASAQAFLADSAAGGPGCLITDVHMPGMNGLELLDTVRERALHLPVIVITGRADARLINQLKNAGACAVFEKPIDDTTLLQAIEQAVAN